MWFLGIVQCRSPSRIYLYNGMLLRYGPEPKSLLTREVTVHPDEGTFPFPDSSGSDHDKLKSHLFEPLYTTQSV